MKNIILLNNRSLHLYDFKELKKNNSLRLSAVLFNESHACMPENIKKSLDEIYILPDCADNTKIFPPFSQESLAPILEKNLSKFKNTWLVATDELNILNAASLREKYNLPGTAYSVSLNYRNKLIQKIKLSDSGIKVPKFMSIHSDQVKTNEIVVFNTIVSALQYPFILKPIDMFGAIGVEKIETYNQFLNYFSNFSNFSYFLAEEFINAQLYHFDFIIQEGEYVFAEVSEYLHNGLSFVNGYNHGSLLLAPNHPLRLPIIDFCKKANSILDLKSGCGHFEVFVTKEKDFIFLEAAARPAGSSVPVVLTKTFEKNYMNTALLAEIEENPGTFSDPAEHYFWGFFPKKPGIVKSFRPLLIKSLYNVEWFTHVGDIIHKPISIAEKSGSLIAKNKNYDILQSDFYSLRNFEAIEVESN